MSPITTKDGTQIYIGRHGTRRVANALLIGAVPPL